MKGGGGGVEGEIHVVWEESRGDKMGRMGAHYGKRSKGKMKWAEGGWGWEACLGWGGGGGKGSGRERCQKGREEQIQTPSTGLRHPSSNVPERQAWRVEQSHIPSIAFRHPSSLEKGCRY